MQAELPAEIAVVDLTGLAELVATMKKPGGRRRGPTPASQLCKRRQARAIRRGVDRLQRSLGDVSRRLASTSSRGAPARAVRLVVVGGGVQIEALPNLAGTAKITLSSHSPAYISEKEPWAISLAESPSSNSSPTHDSRRQQLEKRPPRSRTRRSCPIAIRSGTATARSDATGRPATRTEGTGTEHYAGSKEEFVAAWNRYFWARFQPALEQKIPTWESAAAPLRAPARARP